jgi:hypothetical protein
MQVVIRESVDCQANEEDRDTAEDDVPSEFGTVKAPFYARSKRQRDSDTHSKKSPGKIMSVGVQPFH